jgi:hypothetical protein
MVSLTNKIGTVLFRPLAINNMLAHGRIGRLAGGIRRTKDFIQYLLTLYKSHGLDFTIKYLKSCHVAIAKCLGKNKVLSLRTLEPELNLPRLAGGLPKIIPYQDRLRIRRGHVPTIRFWLGLFNIYRVLRAIPKAKITTITAPWTGHKASFRTMLRLSRVWSPFRALEGFDGIPLSSLVPYRMVPSQSASPSNKVALLGVFTDVQLIKENNPGLWNSIHSYLDEVGAQYFKELLHRIDAVNLGLRKYDGFKDPSVSDGYHTSKSGKFIYPGTSMKLKPALAKHGLPAGDGLSQFAIKEEAAGKVRVFALVDEITQSIMRPLHDQLFELLGKIPNDGTFNQDASVERCMEKAVNAGCAFSFDLSAATDRLPVLLTEKIIKELTGSSRLAFLWKCIMTRRPFGFIGPTAKKLGLDPDTEYRYSVGQPMGALSSWAGLAITHHWIVQASARLAYPLDHKTKWFEGYEVLGDDIVIFDPLVAEQYLDIMKALGTEINLTKSIVSKDRPVFEFAKRICWGFAVVSGISFNQVRASWNVGSRLASVLQFWKMGLLENSSSLMSALLSRDAFSNGKALRSAKTSSPRDQKARALGLLALLGERYQNGILSLKEVVKLILNPKDIESGGNAVAIPIQLSTQLAYAALVEPSTVSNYKPSQDKEREYLWDWKKSSLNLAVYSDIVHLWNDGISETMVGIAGKWKERMFNPLHYYDVETFTIGDAIPMTDVPADYRATLWDMEDLVHEMFHQEIEGDYNILESYLVEFITNWAKDKYSVDLEHLLDIRAEIESLTEKVELRPDTNKPKEVLLETASVLKDLDPRQAAPMEFAEEGLDYAFW